VRIPPSLRNIHAELHDDLGIAIPNHGNLARACCSLTPR
jgi:uracil-DNA glycosylase